MRQCCFYCLGLAAVLLLLAGIVLVLSGVFPRFLQSRVKKEVVLKNATDAFEAWEDPPAQIYMQFYFFNVTNPLEVLDGERPAVVEVGPYTYREYRPMEEVTFQANGTRVAAVNTKTYIFQPEMSRGPESDPIRTLNIPAVTVMERFRKSWEAELISPYMRSLGVGLFTTRTVGELLWGYEDSLLRVAKKFWPQLDDVFGLFYKSNASNDGRYVFFTGEQDYRDFARVDTWNGESSLAWWSTDECNMINGTTGASFHPVVTKGEKLYMFSSDLCRSLYAVYEEDVTVKGIAAYRFSPPSEVFANTTANAGFCVPPGNCPGSGLLDVRVCKSGAPIVMSSPHFYQAEEKFKEAVFGMRPDKQLHQTAIDIHPLTGVVLQAAKRLQINVHVEKIPHYSQTGNVRTLVFPVVYLNESALIQDAAARKLRAVVTVQQVVVQVPFMLMGLGFLLGLVFTVLVCRHRTPQHTPPESTAAERQPLLSS
uniref:Scavenger receptor class B, member 2c n=1 Tax=Tetraodon nigroviridis TaxID=99883 RepID=H3C430_TETNG